MMTGGRKTWLLGIVVVLVAHWLNLFALGVALAVVLLATRRNATEPAPFGVLLLVFCIPAAFLAWNIVAAPPAAKRLRLALMGVGLTAQPADSIRATIGGNTAVNELLVLGLVNEEEPNPDPAAYVAFRPDTARRLRGPLVGSFPGEPPAIIAQTVRVGWRKDPLRPLRALQLEPDDEVSAGGLSYRFQPGSSWSSPGRLVGPRDTLVIPARRAELPLLHLGVPVLAPLRVRQATYPLLLADSAIQVASSSFLFVEPGFLWVGRPRVWLSVGSDQVQVRRAGQLLGIPREHEVARGSRIHVMGPPRVDPGGNRAGGIRDLRSVRVTAGDSSLIMHFDTPEIYSLQRSEVNRLTLQPGSDTARINLNVGDWQVTERGFYFRHVSNLVGAEVLSVLEFSTGLWRGRPSNISAATPSGLRRGPTGEPIRLGHRRQIAVQFDVLRLPWLLAGLVVLVALLKAIAADSVRLPISTALFAGALEGIIALRLLLGYQAWALPPFKQEAYELALVAWSLLPWTLIALSIPPHRTGRDPTLADAKPAVAGLVFSAIWCLRITGGAQGMIWVACHLLVLAIYCVRSWSGLRMSPKLAFVKRTAQRDSFRWLQRTRSFARASAGRVDRVLKGDLGTPIPRAFWVIPALFLLIRFVLSSFGIREAIDMTPRLSLSLLHVPGAIAVQACYLVWLWRRSVKNNSVRAADCWPAPYMILFLWLLPAFVVSDLGLALLNIPVFLAAFAALLLTARCGRRMELFAADRSRGRRAIAIVALGTLSIGYFAGVALPLSVRTVVRALPENLRVKLESERNFLRLLGFAYPDELSRVARRASEELAIMSAVMERYTAGPVGGRGYFASTVSPHLGATALREHVPSVFVGAQWGVAGAAGLLLLYLVLGVALLPLAPWSSSMEKETNVRVHGAGAFALLAALTLALPSIYMILANYRLVMFTGKNAYLLGLDSAGDVMEALLLVLSVVFCVTLVREKR